MTILLVNGIREDSDMHFEGGVEEARKKYPNAETVGETMLNGEKEVIVCGPKNL